jgi:hypothetical protein
VQTELAEAVDTSVHVKAEKSPASCKEDQRTDVVTGIHEYVKQVLFRTHKFVPPGEALENTCALVWGGIKDRFSLDVGPNVLGVKEFEAIYGGVILSSLSCHRQYHQTRCQLAAKGT